jgi:hypothetical protein
MNLSEINNIINDVISEEIRKTIIMESSNKEVYHIKCDGEPIATFDSEKEAQEALPDYKAKTTGELIIEKGVYESHEDMLDKLDEMGEELEEKETKNMENQEPTEGNAFTGALIKAKEAGEKTFTVDGEEHNVEESWSKMEEEECNECGEMNEDDEDGNDVHSIWGKYSEAALNENSPEDFSDEFEYADNVIHHIVQDAIANGDVDEEDADELNDDIKDNYGDTLMDSYRDNGGDMGDDFEDDDDSFGDDYENLPDGDVNEEAKMCSECGGMLNEEGMCSECSGKMMESKKKTLRLKESEMLEMIQRIVKESVPGITVTKKAQTQSKKDNESNASEVAKKIKGATTFDGNDNPEFPKPIGKGEKVARKNTPEQEEEIQDNRGGGLEDLHYDMEPSQQFKDRLKKSLEGHTSTGNSQEAGNVIKSDLGKNIAKKVERKHKQREDEVMYNKDVQPVKVVKESKNNLSSILEEEIKKMKNMASYDKKTQ